MAIRYTRSMAGQNWARMSRELQGIVEEEMADAGLESAQEGQCVIENSGTGNEWSSPFTDVHQGGTRRSGPGAGRINTGQMLNDLSFRLVTGQGVGLDVGWIDRFLDYYAAQDRGTGATGYRHGGRAIVGMGVMARLQVFVRARVDEAVDRSIERMMRGL